MRCRPGGVFAKLRPYQFDGIQLGRTDGELMHLHPRVAFQPIFHVPSAVDRMAIPQQFGGSHNLVRKVRKKFNYFISTD